MKDLKINNNALIPNEEFGPRIPTQTLNE